MPAKEEGLFRLHTGACIEKYARGNREAKDCRCMIHFEGLIGEDFIRKSVGTRAWSKAVAVTEAARKAGAWKVAEPEPEVQIDTNVTEAVSAFLEHAKSIQGYNLSPNTVRLHRITLKKLEAFCKENGYSLPDLSPDILAKFKDSWTLHSVYSIRSSVQTVRAFFEFAYFRKLVDSDPSVRLKAPRMEAVEVMPFTEDEEKRIYSAATGKALLLCYVMRFAGMAIIDAANLYESEVKGDEIRYYRIKNKRRENRRLVIVPIPEWLAIELRNTSKESGYYFRHKGADSYVTVKHWRWYLERRVFRKAGVANGQFHRFRHTFATRLLEAGERIEDVSKWLGHSSVKTTERYYSHWTEDRTNTASEKLRRFYLTNGHKPV